MNGLQEQFGDQIEFVALDVDDAATLPTREKFDIVQRTRYVLVAPDGETVVQRWFGLLDENQIAEYMADYLASLP